MASSRKIGLVDSVRHGHCTCGKLLAPRMKVLTPERGSCSVPPSGNTTRWIDSTCHLLVSATLESGTHVSSNASLRIVLNVPRRKPRREDKKVDGGRGREAYLLLLLPASVAGARDSGRHIVWREWGVLERDRDDKRRGRMSWQRMYALWEQKDGNFGLETVFCNLSTSRIVMAQGQLLCQLCQLFPLDRQLEVSRDEFMVAV